MKHTLLALGLIYSTASFALSGKVVEAFCGEMDPFVVGDVCIVNTDIKKNEKQNIALVMNFDEFLEKYEDGTLDGKDIVIDESSIMNLQRRETIRVLQDFDDDYFYMSADIDAITIVTEDLTINDFMRLSKRNFRSSKLPVGFTAKKLDATFANKVFKQKLKQMEIGKRSAWRDYVINSGEYDNITIAEARELINNPEIGFGSALLEIDEVYAISHNGKIIGYYVEVMDHVEGAIIQDGAWMEMFLDADQKIVYKTDETS